MNNLNIILIGPMGSGKSTIGHIMAKKLKRDFQDSDHYIERKTGVDIPRIFDVEGEYGFRDRETQALQDILPLNNQIIATGGGGSDSRRKSDVIKVKWLCHLSRYIGQPTNVSSETR
jgi:shikimate kinase